MDRAAYYGSVNGSTTPTAVLAPNEVEVVRARYNLPPITVYDVQISVDNTYQRVIPEDRWILLPPNPESWAETQYGITAEALGTHLRYQPGHHPRGHPRHRHHRRPPGRPGPQGLEERLRGRHAGPVRPGHPHHREGPVMPTIRTVATAVFVTDPRTHETLLLRAGAEINDPAIVEQITHPDAWAPEPPRRSHSTKTEAS